MRVCACVWEGGGGQQRRGSGSRRHLPHLVTSPPPTPAASLCATRSHRCGRDLPTPLRVRRRRAAGPTTAGIKSRPGPARHPGTPPVPGATVPARRSKTCMSDGAHDSDKTATPAAAGRRRSRRARASGWVGRLGVVPGPRTGSASDRPGRVHVPGHHHCPGRPASAWAASDDASSAGGRRGIRVMVSGPAAAATVTRSQLPA